LIDGHQYLSHLEVILNFINAAFFTSALLKIVVTFVCMRERNEIKYYLTFAFAVLLFLNNLSFNLIPSSDILSIYDCPDTSKHFEHSNDYSLENDFLCSETAIPGCELNFKKDLTSFDNPILEFHFNSPVWEPPKFS